MDFILHEMIFLANNLTKCLFFFNYETFFKKSSPHIFTHIINSLLTLRDVKEINQCLVYRNHLKWQTFKLFFLFKSKTMFSKLPDMAGNFDNEKNII